MSNNEDFKIEDGILYEYLGNEKHVVIPDSVRTINHDVFFANHTITTLEVPNSVTSIKESAFHNCVCLEQVTLPNSIIEIEKLAFAYCNLNTFTFPKGVTVVAYCVLGHNKNLTKITLSENTSIIEFNAFEYCEKLTDINIPTTVTEIGLCAFKGCKRLDFDALGVGHKVEIKGDTLVDFCDIGIGGSYEIPDGIKKIASQAFSNCMSIEKIIFPDSVAVIEELAFYSCMNIKELTISSYAFNDCENLKKLTFNEGLQTIDRGAFIRCVNLEEIVFPKSLTKIGADSFNQCTSLKRITLMNKETEMDTTSFIFCDNLEEVSFEVLKTLFLEQQSQLLINKFSKNGTMSKEELSYINRKPNLKKLLLQSDCHDIISYLLNKKTKLKLKDLNEYLELSISENRTIVTAIYLDYKNKNYSAVEIAEAEERKELLDIGLVLPTFTELRKNFNCSKKNEVVRISGYKGNNSHVTIPASLSDGSKVVKLGININNYYEPIEVLTIETGITEIEKNTFKFTETLREINLPDSITSIGNSAFLCCCDLGSITLPKKLKEINKFAFQGCERLEEVIIPDGVTQINESAFACCMSLKEITIPASVKFIGNYAFLDCKSLSKVNFLGEMPKLGYDVFLYCPVIVTSIKSIKLT